MNPPERLPELPAIETQDVRRTILVDTATGTVVTIATATETIRVDPATGSRAFTATNTFLAARDGPIIVDPNTTMLYTCTICGARCFTSDGVVRCSCGRIACKATCLTVDADGLLCRRCAYRPWWRRVWSWLCRLPS